MTKYVAEGEELQQTTAATVASGTPSYGAATILAISGGVLDISGTDSRNIVAAAESGTSDTVDTVTGLGEGEEAIFSADTGDTITFAHGTDNIILYNGNPLVLTGNALLKLVSPDGASARQTIDENDGTAGSGSTTTVGVYADTRPASPNAGDTFVPKDGLWHEIYHDSIWNPYKNGLLLTKPPTTGWTWDNQGGATIDWSIGAGYLYVPAGTSTLSMRLQHRAAPSTPYTITVLVDPLMLGLTQPYYAVGFRQSSSGKLHALMLQANLANLQLYSAKFTNSTTFSANYVSTQYWKQPVWFRIADNGTNRILSVSTDGKNFLPYHTVGRTDFLTADQVFFGLAPTSATYDAGLTLNSWAVT